MTPLERARALIGDAPMYVRDGLTDEQIEDFAQQIRTAIDTAIREDVAEAMPLYQVENDTGERVMLSVRHSDWMRFLHQPRPRPTPEEEK